jgi:hypothetical protein
MVHSLSKLGFPTVQTRCQEGTEVKSGLSQLVLIYAMAEMSQRSGRNLVNRLTNLDNGAFERVGRYESALMRQMVKDLAFTSSDPALLTC